MDDGLWEQRCLYYGNGGVRTKLDSERRIFFFFSKVLVNCGRSTAIRLREGAEPFFLSSPRRVPISLYEKTRLELRLMETIVITSPVDVPTEWCAPTVVVLKLTGAARFCVDFTTLDRHVLREWQFVPLSIHSDCSTTLRYSLGCMPIPDFRKFHWTKTAGSSPP